MPQPTEQLTGGRELHRGPVSTRVLPPVLPAGQLPHEQSNMWLFVPKAVQGGERFIQEDTRDWFRDRGFKVPVCREYPDHPRWHVDGAGSRRASIANGNIVSEVHMLVRLHAGLPEYPDWVNARMAIKATQSDVAYRLTKAARKAWLAHGEDAMAAFAQRAPAQFIKFIATTFVPKKVEVSQVPDGSGLDSEERVRLLKALADELKRREEEARALGTTNLLDYEPQHDIVEVADEVAAEMHEATADRAIGLSKGLHRIHSLPQSLKSVKNLIDMEIAEQSIYHKEGTAPPSVMDWSDGWD